MKYLPGLAGAVVGFTALKLVAWLGLDSLTGHALVFLAVYLVATVAVDAAMSRYGTKKQ